MIDAAERLVAERGLAALTLRDVQTEAGQANKSAAQYHFGSREGLLAAVVESRMRPAGERRRELLDTIDLDANPPTMRALVEALVLPLAEQTHLPRGHVVRAVPGAVDLRPGDVVDYP